MQKVLAVPIRAILLIAAVVLLAFAGWSLCFHAWSAAVGTTLLAAVALPVWRRIRLLRCGMAVMILIAGAAWWYVPLHELAKNVNRLSGKLSEKQGLSYSDKLGVYGLNLLMAAGGYLIGFPEAARETLLMSFPGRNVRIWRSGFAMRSPKVRREVRDLIASVRSQATKADRVDLATRSISWNSRTTTPDSPRVVLALNGPAELSGHATREGTRWRFDLTARVPCRYPRRSRMVLIANARGRTVALEEGLFRALEEDGWLHPYTAEWHWHLYDDDPRLNDLTNPFFSIRERIALRVFRGIRHAGH